ncbi:MAG: CvpA family protein [Clostridiaceae bacterium]|nr:CvpA family protein [Clostridiaceae bacterium]
MNKEAFKKRAKGMTVNLTVTLLFGLIYFYFELPAINLHDKNFYGFFFLMSAVYCVSAFITSGIFKTAQRGDFFKNVKKTCFLPFVLCIALIALLLLGSLASSVIFRAGSYTKLLDPKTGDFATDVDEISFNKIPMLDADSAAKLGDRKLGELSDMVSQFEVSDTYYQINYKGSPVRIATLEYGDFFKWLNNRSKGLPAYIVINMVTQNAEVVRLESGMKYSDNELFFRYIYRYIRFKYPTFMFEDVNFEIDDEGTPYWICPRVEKTIGLFGGTDINGAVLVNAITGESQYYEEVPSWVDRVYSADLIMEQYDYHGLYQDGFLNSMFGQKGVTVTTDGYNYIALNDDVFVYTGITSVGGDQSNIGFILVNQRTKESKFYSCAGAEEYSAMNSAEGVVQHLKYNATFPLLLNVASEPTYFMALKDNANLVKLYAMVNVQQYNIVATGDTVASCEKEYTRLLVQNGVVQGTIQPINEVTGKVEDIRTAVIEGNSYYYFRIEGKDWYYCLPASTAQTAIIVNIGDTVVISDADETGTIRNALNISIK